MSANLVPFYAQYSTGHNAAATPAASVAGAAPVDVVDLRRSQLGGGFTAQAGDRFALSSLYAATAPAGGVIQNYQVALRGDQAPPNAGQLLLDSVDVSGRTSFSPYEFSRLSFVAGPAGSKQDLLVVAQTGTLANDDTLTNPVDSPPVQITATVTGTRSINAAVALQTAPTGADAGFVALAQAASVAVPATAIRPILAAVGNFTAVAGDQLAVSGLYAATAPAGTAIQNFKVSLRGDQASPNAGTLLLDGVDVSSRQDFSPYEFGQLRFVAGPSGTHQDLLVVAQTGTLNIDDTLKDPVDSAAVQITASVTGSRSINAAAALQTTPVGADAGFVALAREASTATTATRPSVTTAGNFTAQAGDTYALAGLFAGPATAQNYKVALRGDQAPPNGGQLVLDGVDVSGRQSFSPYEFSQLSFVAGPAGSNQDLLVVAQTGTLANDDTLTNPVDSPALQITASVTGSRSINAAAALRTTPTGADAGFMALATQAAIATTATRPSLATVGNFTAAAGDSLSVSSLYSGPATAGIQNYQVALRGDQAAPNGGQLTLNGVDVSTRRNFSPYEFGQLSFVAGPSGSNQDLLVVAQTGTLNIDDTLRNPVDSAAVQITASITGTRSINAAAAFQTPAGSDAGFVALAAEATTLAATPRASLTTVGNLTAAAGDRFALSGLYAGVAPAGGAIQNYKVALRGDQAAPNAGTLLLYGADVSSRRSFSAYEFSQLAFVAGPSGSRQDLLVVAQTGTLNNDDTLSNPVDSPAVQITTNVTGVRSLNAAQALQTTPTGGDAAFVALAQAVNATAAARPGLATVGRLDDPETAANLLAGLLGAFQSTGAPVTPAVDVSSLYASAVGGTASTGARSSDPALAAWTAENASLGGYQVAGDGAALQRLAVAAYRAGQRGT